MGLVDMLHTPGVQGDSDKPGSESEVLKVHGNVTFHGPPCSTVILWHYCVFFSLHHRVRWFSLETRQGPEFCHLKNPTGVTGLAPPRGDLGLGGWQKHLGQEEPGAEASHHIISEQDRIPKSGRKSL